MHLFQKKTLPCRLNFALLLILSSCLGEETSKPNTITIARSTTSVLLEFISAVDGSTIPVQIELPSFETDIKAVVVLHGSGGPWHDDDTDGDGVADVCNVGELSSQNEAWRDLLLDEGFAAVFPDSYSPRGTCENEGGYKGPPLKFVISGTFVRNYDAYGTLDLLRNLTWEDTGDHITDPENIFLLGFSDGGTAALSTLYDNDATPPSWAWKQSFGGVTYTDEILPPPNVPERGGNKAGVVYYPGAYHNGYYGRLCDQEGIYQTYCPVMFHLAGQDPLSDNAECLIETMRQRGGGEPTVHRYESVGHSFDGNDEPESTLARGRSIEFLKEFY